MRHMATDQITESCSQGALIETALSDGPVEAASVNWPAECGAECVFLGRTRCEKHERLGMLLRIEYEAYETMAQRALADLALQAADQFGCRWVRMVHARGPVAPGEASVVIQVACPHREAAFSACKHLIDQLKATLPIWKREIWQRGETFVEGRTVSGAV